MFIQKDTTVPGLREAREVQSTIKRLGIQDVELFFDAEIGVWCVVQVRKENTGIVTMDNLSGAKADPWLLWYCTNNDGKYRPPNEKDINDVVATVRRAEKWFTQGGDALVDKLEDQEQDKRMKKEQKLRERLAPHVKDLKRAIREELG